MLVFCWKKCKNEMGLGDCTSDYSDNGTWEKGSWVQGSEDCSLPQSVCIPFKNHGQLSKVISNPLHFCSSVSPVLWLWSAEHDFSYQLKPPFEFSVKQCWLCWTDPYGYLVWIGNVVLGLVIKRNVTSGARGREEFASSLLAEERP